VRLVLALSWWLYTNNIHNIRDNNIQEARFILLLQISAAKNDRFSFATQKIGLTLRIQLLHTTNGFVRDLSYTFLIKLSETITARQRINNDLLRGDEALNPVSLEIMRSGKDNLRCGNNTCSIWANIKENKLEVRRWRKIRQIQNNILQSGYTGRVDQQY
jgi:hypothetical protein